MVSDGWEESVTTPATIGSDNTQGPEGHEGAA